MFNKIREWLFGVHLPKEPTVTKTKNKKPKKTSSCVTEVVNEVIKVKTKQTPKKSTPNTKIKVEGNIKNLYTDEEWNIKNKSKMTEPE